MSDSAHWLTNIEVEQVHSLTDGLVLVDGYSHARLSPEEVLV